MHNEVSVIARVGLEHKTRKSRWPARLELMQSASGLFLGLFHAGTPEEGCMLSCAVRPCSLRMGESMP
jgi:hypothetical protein